MADQTALNSRQSIGFPRRGNIYLVNFDPTVGAEIKKTRPALIVQNDIANRHSSITIVAAITSKYAVPPYPTEVILEPKETGLRQSSAVLLNQVRSIDRARLIKRIGHASAATMRRVDRALQISFGLIRI
ncbi:MAG: type II toxin-antitoxin system PemK/MazF family toxin [Candidatus Korobacteraceae bacterium]